MYLFFSYCAEIEDQEVLPENNDFVQDFKRKSEDLKRNEIDVKYKELEKKPDFPALDIDIKTQQLYDEYLDFLEKHPGQFPDKKEYLKIKDLFWALSQREILYFKDNEQRRSPQKEEVIYNFLSKIVENPSLINLKSTEVLAQFYGLYLNSVPKDIANEELTNSINYLLSFIKINIPKCQQPITISKEIKQTLYDFTFISTSFAIDFLVYQYLNPYFCVSFSAFKSIFLYNVLEKFTQVPVSISLQMKLKDTIILSLLGSTMTTTPMYSNNRILSELPIVLRNRTGIKNFLLKDNGETNSEMIQNAMKSALLFSPQILLYNAESTIKYNIFQNIYEKINQSLFELSIYEKYNQITEASDRSDFMCVSDRMCNPENYKKMGKIILNVLTNDDDCPYVYFDKAGDFFMFKNLIALVSDKLGISIEEKKCTKTNYSSFVKGLEYLRRDLLEFKEAKKFCNFYNENEYTKRFFIFILKFTEILLFKFSIKTSILSNYYFMEFNESIYGGFDGPNNAHFHLSKLLEDKEMRRNNGIIALFKRGASDEVLNKFNFGIKSKPITFKQLVSLVRRKMLSSEFLPLIINKIDDISKVIYLMAQNLWRGGYDQDTYEDKIDYWIKLFIYESDNIDSVMGVF